MNVWMMWQIWFAAIMISHSHMTTDAAMVFKEHHKQPIGSHALPLALLMVYGHDSISTPWGQACHLIIKTEILQMV